MHGLACPLDVEEGIKGQSQRYEDATLLDLKSEEGTQCQRIWVPLEVGSSKEINVSPKFLKGMQPC